MVLQTNQWLHLFLSNDANQYYCTLGCRNSETSNGRSKKTKTLVIRANYSTNKGIYVWPFTSLFRKEKDNPGSIL